MDIRKLIKNYQTPPNGQEIIKCGNILLIAGVSGAGKDSIKHKLVSGKKYGDIISHTTRPPRVNNKIIEKVILALYFFNNERFNKRELDNQQNETFWYKTHTCEFESLHNFLSILKEQYNDRIEQIDKILNYENNVVHRKLQFKVQILELTKEFVKIKRTII